MAQSKRNGLDLDKFKVVEMGFLISKDDAAADLELQQFPGTMEHALMFWVSERPAALEDVTAFEDYIHDKT